MTADRVIGCDDALPWDLPDEYAHFLACIRGQSVIMGRRSWEIFGGDLTSDHHVVVSRTADEIPGATVARSFEDALATASAFGRTVFSAGGATIYAATLPRADALWLSIIHNRYAGDTYFPAVDAESWREVRREPHDGWDFVVSHRRSTYGRQVEVSGTGE
jgi:dihydrofolate reductase